MSDLLSDLIPCSSNIEVQYCIRKLQNARGELQKRGWIRFHFAFWGWVDVAVRLSRRCVCTVLCTVCTVPCNREGRSALV